MARPYNAIVSTYFPGGTGIESLVTVPVAATPTELRAGMHTFKHLTTPPDGLLFHFPNTRKGRRFSMKGVPRDLLLVGVERASSPAGCFYKVTHCEIMRAMREEPYTIPSTTRNVLELHPRFEAPIRRARYLHLQIT